jgi:guanylate kinase
MLYLIFINEFINMKLLTLTGPSCSGKTTLLNELVANHGFTGITSHTTRPPRKGEIDGKDYYFITEPQFAEMSKSGQLMESVTFNGYHYGVSVTEVAEATIAGKTPVVIVEPNGLVQMRKYAEDNGIDLCSFFIDGDLSTLIQRYLMRASTENLADGETAYRNARRIASLFKEHEDWGSLQMKKGISLYDHKLYDYNKHTEKGYIQQIKDKI